MPVGITNATDLPLALAPLMQAAHEGGEVGPMPQRGRRGDRQMLEAERLDGPGRVIRQDVTDPSLLGTREHGAAIVAERARLGQGGARLRDGGDVPGWTRMRRRGLAGWLVIAIGTGGCAWMSLPATAESAYESTACGMTRDGPDGKPWFYPPGQREACLRVLTGLAGLTAQHAQGQRSELAFLVRAVTLLKGADARAVLAASTAPNGGWLGEHKHAYEQALEAAGRSAGRV